MTRSETLAFNAGVAAVIELAAASADAIGRKLIQKPTRYNFAHAALAAIVDEANALRLPLSSDQTEGPHSGSLA